MGRCTNKKGVPLREIDPVANMLWSNLCQDPIWRTWSVNYGWLELLSADVQGVGEEAGHEERDAPRAVSDDQGPVMRQEGTSAALGRRQVKGRGGGC